MPLPNSSLKLIKHYSLDGDTNNSTLPIANILYSQSKKIEFQTYFFSLFRVFAIMQKATCNNSLEPINMLLGCGIVIYDPENSEQAYFSYSEDIQAMIQESYYFILLWFRELLSAFGDQKELSIIEKCKVRLSECTKLQAKLQEFSNQKLYRKLSKMKSIIRTK